MTAHAPNLQTLYQGRLARLVEAIRQAREELSEKNVHELRVACRRLDSVLQLLAPPPEALRKRVRRLRGKAGSLRDLHVLQAFLETQRVEWPLLERVLRHLPRQIEREQKKLGRKLHRLKLKKLHEELDFGAVSQSSLLESYAARQEEFRGSFGRDWHEVRVALKQYRYLAELVQAMGLAQPDLEELKGWQERLGAIHDLEVHAAHLGEQGMPAYVAHLRTERDRLIAAL